MTFAMRFIGLPLPFFRCVFAGQVDNQLLQGDRGEFQPERFGFLAVSCVSIAQHGGRNQPTERLTLKQVFACGEGVDLGGSADDGKRSPAQRFGLFVENQPGPGQGR